MSFINTAVAAQDAAQGSAASPWGTFFMMGALLVVFYFLLWRPQNKRMKEHRDLVANINKGDEVATSGGLLGKVTKVTDSFLSLVIAEGVEINVQKNAISTVLPKGTLSSI